MTTASSDPQSSGATASRFAVAYGSSTRFLPRIFQIAWIGSFGILACLSMMMVPVAPVVPELDWSWAGALPYFAHRGLDFGTEVVFTYGPLGHFAGFAYTEYSSITRIVWEIVIKATGATLCCCALAKLRPVIQIPFALGVILFVGNYEESYFVIFLLAGCLLFRSAPRNFVLYALVGSFFAMLSLVKFSYFLQAICTIGPVGSYLLVRRYWPSLISLTTSFVVGILVCWYLTGQKTAHFPAYISHSLAMTDGYTSAMSTPTLSGIALSLAITSSILFFIQLLVCLLRDRTARTMFGSIFMMLMCFLLWKHAFTRWDHAQRFFFLFPELMLAAWLLKNHSAGVDRMSLTVTFLAIAFSLIGAAIVEPVALLEAATRSVARMRQAYRVITDYKQFDSECQARLREAKDRFSLPKIKALIGSQSIDVVGYGQGIALLNDLNYTPRPVFQGYSAYTSSLVALNTAYYQSAKRPEFVISKLQPIDGRFPTLDDAPVWLELLYRYQPVISENGWQLWKAQNMSEPVRPGPLSDITAKLDQEIAIPGRDPVWLQIELRQTDRGRIRSFFYKPAPVTIELIDDAGQASRYRIIPSMAAAGFLLNPRIIDDQQVSCATKRGGALPYYRSFKVYTDSTDLKKIIQIHFSSLPPPANF